MERDSFDAAIDEILDFTSGDIRLALRTVLVESVLLEEELRQMRAASPHANSIETNNSPPINFPSRRTLAIKRQAIVLRNGCHKPHMPGQSDAVARHGPPPPQAPSNEILTYDHLLEVAHLEQEQVAKHAVADKVYKLASGVMVLAVVAVGGYALFVQLSANALTPTTAAEQTARESAAIVTAEPAGEEAASASAVPPETSGPADVPTSAKVSAAERTPSGTAETAPRRVGPPLHRTPKHSPKFASGYIDRSIILYRLRKFARVFAEQSKHARLTRRHGNARPFGA